MNVFVEMHRHMISVWMYVCIFSSKPVSAEKRNLQKKSTYRATNKFVCVRACVFVRSDSIRSFARIIYFECYLLFSLCVWVGWKSVHVWVQLLAECTYIVNIKQYYIFRCIPAYARELPTSRYALILCNHYLSSTTHYQPNWRHLNRLRFLLSSLSFSRQFLTKFLKKMGIRQKCVWGCCNKKKIIR